MSHCYKYLDMIKKIKEYPGVDTKSSVVRCEKQFQRCMYYYTKYGVELINEPTYEKYAYDDPF